jgi:hypothetical protein
MLSGRASLAALAAVFCMLGAVAIFEDGGLLLLVLVIGMVIAWRHRPNIKRLMSGEETAVIRPVRWGRKPEHRVSEHVLEQSPSGISTGPSEWAGEETDDPMVEEPTIEEPTLAIEMGDAPQEDG